MDHFLQGYSAVMTDEDTLIGSLWFGNDSLLLRYYHYIFLFWFFASCEQFYACALLICTTVFPVVKYWKGASCQVFQRKMINPTPHFLGYMRKRKINKDF